MARKALLLLTVFLLVPWALTRPITMDPDKLPTGNSDPVNGEQVFHAGGCASCHGKDLAGGLEMHTPFGTFLVPNISPDPDAGIGGWSTLDLANAMTEGVSPSGKHYYPAFPYTSYARMKLKDVADLKAYLDTFEAKADSIPDHDIGFPWNVRRGIGLWKRRYLGRAHVTGDEGLTEVAERGRYLVEALGHCGECHTPRDRFGGPDNDNWMAGGPNPDGEGKIPNITPHEDGLADWSQSDIAYYLESGFTPDFDTAGGSMVAVQENFAQLPAADLEAVAAYLKSIPAKATADQ
jgi:mono/diheme cytochrome c family protein